MKVKKLSDILESPSRTVELLGEPKWNCAKCRDTRTIIKIAENDHPFKGQEYEVACECVTYEVTSQYSFARGPDPSMPLETFPAGQWKTKAHRAAIAYAANPQGGIVFWGPPSVGKTGLANGIALKLGGLIVNWIKLLDAYRAGFNDRHLEMDIDHFITTTDLIVIDDFGRVTRDPTKYEWRAEKAYQIIDDRYVRKLPVVYTTNLSPEQISREFGQPVLDRIYETCSFYKVAGDNLRVSK